MRVRRLSVVMAASLGVVGAYRFDQNRRLKVITNIPSVSSTIELPLLPFGLSQGELNNIIKRHPEYVTKLEDKYLNDKLANAIFEVERADLYWNTPETITLRVIDRVVELSKHTGNERFKNLNMLIDDRIEWLSRAGEGNISSLLLERGFLPSKYRGIQ